MNATKPLWTNAVNPSNAIKTMIIGNMWNFLFTT